MRLVNSCRPMLVTGGYEHLSDVEIIVEVTSELIHDDSDDEGDTATEPFGNSSCASVSISHGEAVKMFDSCITWLQLQEEASPHNLSVLHDKILQPKRH